MFAIEYERFNVLHLQILPAHRQFKDVAAHAFNDVISTPQLAGNPFVNRYRPDSTACGCRMPKR